MKTEQKHWKPERGLLRVLERQESDWGRHPVKRRKGDLQISQWSFWRRQLRRSNKCNRKKIKQKRKSCKSNHAFLMQLEATIQQQTVQYTMTEQHLLQSLTMQQQQQQQQMHQFAAMQNNMMALMEQQRQQSELIMEILNGSILSAFLVANTLILLCVVASPSAITTLFTSISCLFR